MRAVLLVSFVTAPLLSFVPAPLPSAPAQTTVVRIRIETEVGDIVAELFPDRAPATVANFLKYVDAGHYHGGSFYRAVRPDNQPDSPVKIEVIQGGVHPWRQDSPFPQTALERTSVTGLMHRDGALSMARGKPDTATSQFFICIGDQPELDFGGKRNADGQGFAAFGQVIEGMDVVRRIQASRAEGQGIMPPIRILKIVRVPSPEG
jgi:peptidyl-prolyl cis-trans isomerase A (cyclophilin A)